MSRVGSSHALMSLGHQRVELVVVPLVPCVSRVGSFHTLTCVMATALLIPAEFLRFELR
ncbi:hypothetical protein F511_36635 [Dorcoceras hygrometricum]|uniref:Uncharacterized protein n=1 Tax=Dorcoceras hygrometricum TaxID=472368 RepID=A0A2Z7CQT0_9LAMI|nr:hypothetical protein F511_36635 [Dorcoceras hygrometricum]